jgi:uncharacterized protein involved in exopolysaccharide biosynthesis
MTATSLRIPGFSRVITSLSRKAFFRRTDVEQTQELDIQRYLQIVVKRRYLFAIAAAAIITVVVIISYVIPPIYEAKTVVSVEQSFLNDVLKNLGGKLSVDDKASALSTIMKSRTVVFRVLSDLGIEVQNMTEAQVEGLIKSAQDRTQISIEFNKSGRRDVDFFTVSFRDPNPQLARDYVNNVVSKYIEGNLGSKREDSFGANRFLLGQIDQFKAKVDKIDMEIAALKKDRNIILYDQYLELQKRLDDLLVQYTENHPEVIKMRSEIAALKSKFRASGRKPGEAEGPEDHSSDKKDNNLAGVVRVRNQLTILERERESSKKIYDELAAAYGKSEVSTQAEIQDKAGTFKIVDPAVLPIKPVSPIRIIIILLGIIGGIAGAFGLLVVIDTLDKSVKSVDVLRSFGVPVLAVIPHIQEPSELVKTRVKDIALSIFIGLFVVILGAVMIRELLILRG